MPFSRQLQQLRGYLQTRPDVRQILGNTSWLFSERIFKLAVGLLIGSWVARYLGTKQYGQLNVAYAYIVLIMPVLKMGMDAVIVHKIVDDISVRDKVLGSALVIRLLVSAILLPLVLLVTVYLNPVNQIINMITAILAVGAVIQSFEIIDLWFQSQVISKYTVSARLVAFVVTSVLKVLAIIFSASLLVFGLLLLMDTVIYTLSLVILYQRSGENLRQWTFRTELAKDLISTSWPLIIAGLAVAAYMRIDQVMLAQLMPGSAGEEAVGIYASAVRIAEAWYFVPTAIVSSVFPAILQTKKGDASLYYKRLQRLFNLVVFISYIFAAGVTLLAPFVIHILYGPDFADASVLLIILMWSGVWVSLGVARTPILHAEDQLQFAMWSTGAGAVTNIILNLWMIPQWGAVGCAIATLVSQAVAAHISTLIYSPVRSIGKLQTISLFYPNPFMHRKIKL